MKIEANVDFNPRNGGENGKYAYFAGEIFKYRAVIEHANDWQDVFKALLKRF